MEDTPVAFATITGQIINCNKQFAEICGLPENELKKMNVKSLIKNTDPMQMLELAYSLDLLSSHGPDRLDVWRASLGKVDPTLNRSAFEIIAHISDLKLNGQTALEITLKETRYSELRKSRATFTPLESKGPDSPQHKSESKSGEGKSDDPNRPQRVLVVDDAVTSLKIMAKMISSMGHHVSMAENGLSALELLRAENFDIVLMDLNMPKMNGLEASHEFRLIERHRMEGCHNVRPIKLIAMSGDHSSSIVYEVTNAGFDAFVPKPLTREKFTEILNMNFSSKHK